jgi:hypothetical protein
MRSKVFRDSMAVLVRSDTSPQRSMIIPARGRSVRLTRAVLGREPVIGIASPVGHQDRLRHELDVPRCRRSISLHKADHRCTSAAALILIAADDRDVVTMDVSAVRFRR